VLITARLQCALTAITGTPRTLAPLTDITALTTSWTASSSAPARGLGAGAVTVAAIGADAVIMADADTTAVVDTTADVDSTEAAVDTLVTVAGLPVAAVAEPTLAVAADSTAVADSMAVAGMAADIANRSS